MIVSKIRRNFPYPSGAADRNVTRWRNRRQNWRSRISGRGLHGIDNGRWRHMESIIRRVSRNINIFRKKAERLNHQRIENQRLKNCENHQRSHVLWNQGVARAVATWEVETRPRRVSSDNSSEIACSNSDNELSRRLSSTLGRCLNITSNVTPEFSSFEKTRHRLRPWLSHRMTSRARRDDIIAQQARGRCVEARGGACGLARRRSNARGRCWWRVRARGEDSVDVLEFGELKIVRGTQCRAKIVKLIKNKNQGKKDGNLTKDSELVELIDDFHKQYQALYALHDNLKGEVKEKVQDLENKDSSSSTSSSDSESYHSVDEASARSSPRHALIQRFAIGGRQLDNVLQQELHSLSSQKSESESSLDKATQEISDFLIQIENLKEKLERKTMDLQRMLEEKEGLERQVKGLELEVGSLRSQKSELEDQLRSKNHEADQLRVEKEGLHIRISELERLVMEKSDELSALQQKFKCLENDSFSQIKALEEELRMMRQELDSLQVEKSQLELQIEREKQESLENLVWMEKQNIELTIKITEHQTTLTGQEEVINKLNEEHKQITDQYLKYKLNFQVAEKKIEETVEEFCKKFEDSLRILSRRIRVADKDQNFVSRGCFEQLHVENKDVYRRTKEKYEVENTDLKERVASTEVAVKRMKEISLTANDMLFGLDAVAMQFEQCSGNFLNRISKASCEVLFAKDWVQRKNKTLKHVQEDVDCLLVQPGTKEAEVLGLREKVWRLENKVRELEKMVKEKKKECWEWGREEKRETIRQLCAWIDYFGTSAPN
ncbi:hypothetical protein Acr_18g0008040 [Actinidia rufa]|uniref:Myosin heavy chain-like protein n=1 Tax=Actinidia rufa TaxID=165716 RepID=A0A7J0G760_9ERIC|nr:hypothetical protein Acr_18g0008040 [Actinidia rufa]